MEALFQIVPLAVEILSIRPTIDPKSPGDTASRFIAQLLEHLLPLRLLAKPAHNHVFDEDDAGHESEGAKDPDDVFHLTTLEAGHPTLPGEGLSYHPFEEDSCCTCPQDCEETCSCAVRSYRGAWACADAKA